MRDRFDEGVTGAREMWDRLGPAVPSARPAISSCCIECIVAFCAYFVFVRGACKKSNDLRRA